MRWDGYVRAISIIDLIKCVCVCVYKLVSVDHSIWDQNYYVYVGEAEARMCVLVN